MHTAGGVMLSPLCGALLWCAAVAVQLECMSSPLVPFSAKSMSMAAIGAVEAASDVIVKRQLDRCVHVCPTHFALHALCLHSAWALHPCDCLHGPYACVTA
jgi:hypothetical protein